MEAALATGSLIRDIYSSDDDDEAMTTTTCSCTLDYGIVGDGPIKLVLFDW